MSDDVSERVTRLETWLEAEFGISGNVEGTRNRHDAEVEKRLRELEKLVNGNGNMGLRTKVVDYLALLRLAVGHYRLDHRLGFAQFAFVLSERSGTGRGWQANVTGNGNDWRY